jgi:hypothetical protein
MKVYFEDRILGVEVDVCAEAVMLMILKGMVILHYIPEFQDIGLQSSFAYFDGHHLQR